MAQKQKKLEITYETLAKVTGKSYDAIRQDATSKGARKGFDIEDPISVVKYIAANAPEHVKTGIFRVMIQPGGRDRRRTRKRRNAKR